MKHEFMAGFGREIITPPLGTGLYGYPHMRPAKSVHDDLYVNVFSFKSEKTQLLMIGIDVCTVGFTEVDILKGAILDKYGISPENITITGIHTHSGPCTRSTPGWGEGNMEYINTILLPATVKAVSNAISSMQSALMGIGTVESLVGINRRELTLDGEVILGQNPFGILNKKMTVLSFSTLAGKKIATMVHYGAHGTAAGENDEITRDWIGGMCDALEKETGVPTAYIAGQTGDVGPRISNGKTTGNIHYVEELGSLAGKDAIRAFNSIKEYTVPTLSVKCEKIEIPFDPIMPYETAKSELEKIGNTDALVGMPKKMAVKYRTIMDIYEQNLKTEESLVYYASFISIGAVAFASFPFEVFTEISLRLAAHSPFEHTLVLNNTNGAHAYFPAKCEISRGGYEVEIFQNFAPYKPIDDADSAVIKQYVSILKEMKM